MRNLLLFAALLAATSLFSQSKGYVLSGTPITERVQMPMGEVSYFSSSGTTVVIGSTAVGDTANLVVAAPTTVLVNDGAFDNGGVNTGRLRYTGTVTKWFHIACTLSGSPVTNNDEFILAIAKNGASSSRQGWCRSSERALTHRARLSTSLCRLPLMTI